MLISVFGSEDPRKASIDFCEELLPILRDVAPVMTTKKIRVAFQHAWMKPIMRPAVERSLGILIYDFDELYQTIKPTERWVAALNGSEVAVFIIPNHLWLSKKGHEHPMVDQVLMAQALGLRIRSNGLSKIPDLIAARLKEA